MAVLCLPRLPTVEGVFTYSMKNKSTGIDDKILAVMFSDPFGAYLPANSHAVGIFCNDTTCNKSLFEEMKKDNPKGCIGGRASGPPLIYKEGDVAIESTMSADFKWDLTVKVSSEGE